MKKFTFPKHSRLLNARQFRRVAKYGKELYGEHLCIQACESKLSSVKIGLTVSKKYGKAVKRNRFKRLVREAFRLTQHQFPPHYQFNIRPGNKPKCAISLNSIKKEIETLLTRL